MKYRKKPIVVHAFQFGKMAFPVWFYCECPYRIHPSLYALKISSESGMEAIIRTLEGEMTAREGDYIVLGVNGEIYPVKADIFEKTYERVDDDATV